MSLPGFHADPSLVRVGDRYWVHPTTDGFADWGGTTFSAFSSPDLVDWTDHGVVLRLGTDVPWASVRAWAPAMVPWRGRFHLFFCGEQAIGHAVADAPDGPFAADPAPLVPRDELPGQAIDPSFALDDDGTPLLLWGNTHAFVAPLSDDLATIDRTRLREVTPEGFREALALHRHDGRRYWTWSEDDTRDPEYRVAWGVDDGAGGIERRGVLLEQRPELGILATGHHDLLEVPGSGTWVIAYHRFAIGTTPPGDGTHREVVFDELHHTADGGLAAVPTLEGLRLPLPS